MARTKRPTKTIDATQAWFWTPEWQAGERAADADLKAGRGQVFDSGEKFITALESIAKPAARSKRVKAPSKRVGK